MNTEIRKWIDRRRREIDTTYDLPPEEKRKAEAMLERLERLGGRCRTESEFRRRFATQTMYQDFNCMLLEFALYLRPESVEAINRKYGKTTDKQFNHF
jgi:hypothetical protein